jgi:hypothetical protein
MNYQCAGTSGTVVAARQIPGFRVIENHYPKGLEMTGAKPSRISQKCPPEVRAMFLPSEDVVREQLGKILMSRFFANSIRLGRFLSFAAKHALNGRGERLKEYVVGVEVFDRDSAYDPRIDPIVRVEARRLRSKLKSYYISAGRDDRLVVELPKGGYPPVFRLRTQMQPKPRRLVLPASAETAIAVLPFANLARQI